jgi:hypothetical protein
MMTNRPFNGTHADFGIHTHRFDPHFAEESEAEGLITVSIDPGTLPF